MPGAVLFLDGSATVTTAESITNIVCTYNQHIGLGNNGRVTAAIDLLNTGHFTTFDNHMTLLAGCRQIIGLITATIDRLYLISIFSA